MSFYKFIKRIEKALNQRYMITGITYIDANHDRSLYGLKIQFKKGFMVCFTQKEMEELYYKYLYDWDFNAVMGRIESIIEQHNDTPFQKIQKTKKE